MSEPFDFERYWLNKFSGCLDDIAGQEVRNRVMAGSEGLSDGSSRQEVVAWSQKAMERLEDLVPAEKKRRDIMTGCACQASPDVLEPMRDAYAARGDIDEVHSMLLAHFRGFLRDSLGLEQAMIDEVLDRGWGMAGLRQGDTIIATKIPKSGYLVEYMNETDPERRRQIYCHCPRVRDALALGERLSASYCYCGAGYCKEMWQYILQQPVEVELLESVLDGGEVCKVAVRLPMDGPGREA